MFLEWYIGLSSDAQRKHRLVEKGGEWIGKADSRRRYTHSNEKSKDAGKKKVFWESS